MKGKRIFAVLLLCLMFLSVSCGKAKTIILFNNSPITKDNFLNNATEFSEGKRIYYLFITEKPLDNEFIRVRVFKRDEKAGYQLTKLAYSNDFRLSKDQIYYYNDYIVINEAGYYCMLIYSKNRLNKPLATADFCVK